MKHYPTEVIRHVITGKLGSVERLSPDGKLVKVCWGDYTWSWSRPGELINKAMYEFIQGGHDLAAMDPRAMDWLMELTQD